MEQVRGASDCHLHVFGPVDRYPAAVEESRIPRGATLDDYLALAAGRGVERVVLVQPSGFGTDNRCLLDALTRIGLSRGRGVVMLDGSEEPPGSLEEWRQLGVRGLRINCFRPDAGRHAVPADPNDMLPLAALESTIRQQAAVAKDLGFSLDLLVTGSALLQLLPTLVDVGVPFTVAHLGMFPAEDGPDAPGFTRFLDFVAAPPRLCWVKATGPYRLSPHPGSTAVRDMMTAVLEVAPDRLIWGSDYPYLGFGDVDASLPFDLAETWFTGDQLRRVLVDNPACLYGFDNPASL